MHDKMGVYSGSRDLFSFWKLMLISQKRYKIEIELQWKTNMKSRVLSNGTNTNDLE